MRTNMLAAAIVLVGGLAAQDGGKAPVSPAKAAYDQVVADWKAKTDESAAARKEVMASDAYKQAVADKDRETMAKLMQEVPRPNAEPLARRAMELAGTFAGDDRVQFYAWAMSFGPQDVAKDAAAKLLADHCGSKALLPVVENGAGLLRTLGQDAGREFLTKVAEVNPVDEIKAYALFWPAYMVQRDQKASAEAKEQATEAIASARKFAEGTMLADRIDAPKFIAERLQIGMESPDIVGEDIDGVPFKLSDYRGKVVVLDFWGFW